MSFATFLLNPPKFPISDSGREALHVLARTGNDSFVHQHGSVEGLVAWLLEELTFDEAARWLLS